MFYEGFFCTLPSGMFRAPSLAPSFSSACAPLWSTKATTRFPSWNALIYEIYKYLEDTKNELTNEEKLLAEQWIQAYKKVPEKTVEKIKQEVNMSFSATTITEHGILHIISKVVDTFA